MSSRSSEFRSLAPFSHRRDASLTLQHAQGPFSFLNPTRGHFAHAPVASPPQDEGADAAEAPVAKEDQTASTSPIKHQPSIDGVHFLWRSRDNRKGRHPLRVQQGSAAAPRRSSHPKEVLRGVLRTLTHFPVWDISWLVAFIFTWGSVVWVINGFFAWLPLVRPSTEFNSEADYGGGITAFIGAILFFELGSLLLILEAVNANDTGCFGWAVETLVDQDAKHQHNNPSPSAAVQYVVDERGCNHHHQNKHNLVGSPQQQQKNHETTNQRRWMWRPSWHELTHHYIYELGFLAGAAQLFGATVFGVAGITALPGIMGHLTPQWRLNAAYWIPQVVGGSGFVVSGLLYMLETQERWWKPAPRLLGWHIALWNLVGAFGFTLCGALGMAYGNSGAQYQASLATFCYLQLYESLSKHPVEEVKTKQADKEALS
ncbi:integral membrane protein [Akanthomyces lecanii RCEF 1005]|uniref:Integral membrane protein n=1 Tax=Akanthomyces lecanii RCEF 1005 TaxID=1081108 RepID=A0A162N6A1_CORDF|nr:integral membrane protein [Akanthomyces lecanii RCEF 1005]